LVRRESVLDDSGMPAPLDPATLPRKAIALRSLLLQREADHAAVLEQQAAELTAARNGLKEQVLRNEQLKLRLARLLRERFGASSEKLRGALDQLELMLGELEEQVAETAPPEPDEPAAPTDNEAPRRKPARKPLPETLPRDVVEHAAPCACPKCGGSLRPFGGAGLRAGIVPCHPACAAEAVLPELRGHCPGPSTQFADPSRHGGTRTSRARAGGEILRPPAAVSPG
jgi:hypothetical protein